MNNLNNTARASKKHSSLARTYLAAGMFISVSLPCGAFGQTALGGSELVLPATAPSNADMVNLKTESAGRFGSFSIVITNTGPVAVTGAAVTDKAGLGGFCPKGNTVTITGSGVPEGSFTVADLSSSGVTLGTIQPGQSASITYSCQAK